MGQGPSGISELEIISSRNIEASFPLKKQGALSMSAICGGTDSYVLRSVENRNYNGLESLFDEIDKAISSTAFSVFLGFIIGFLISFLSVIFFFIPGLLFLMFIPFLGTFSLIFISIGFYFYYTGQRKNKIQEVIENWNRQYGSSQGIRAGPGIAGQVTLDGFLSAVVPFRSKHQRHLPVQIAHIHFCRTNQINQNQGMFMGSYGGSTNPPSYQPQDVFSGGFAIPTTYTSQPFHNQNDYVAPPPYSARSISISSASSILSISSIS